MLVYKIFRDSEWQALRDKGSSNGAAIDLTDGYMHLSTGEQSAETAAKHFAGQADLMLLAIDADAMGSALKWEPSRGGALFPHLYRALQLGEVLWAKPLPLVDGSHVFPDDQA
tara:strand:- start:59387 stop:59725 length:339 start_codon:yes stop_codon:yes gene_type:complete